MKKSKSFDLRLTYGNNRTLRVTGSITPYYPAVMYLRNGDPGYPAEGGEIVDLGIALVHRRKDGRNVLRELQDPQGKLCEKLEPLIFEELSDYND